MRIGHGYDAHRFAEGRECILCGVKIDSPVGPLGHSDADVPVHALMDAMLGAAALRDIGYYFPDSDDRYKGCSSIELLKQVVAMLHSKGYRLSNADITIVTQKPRLSAYIEKMRAALAEAICTDVDNVNVKATTEEKMGFTGSGEGIASHAVVIIEKEDSK